MSTGIIHWVALGRMNYLDALAVQESHRDKLLNGRADDLRVYSVEHPPTITIGRNGTYNNIVAPRALLESIGMEVHEVDRGGDVTYHGPGQLVLYPVMRLGPWDNDVGRYVRMLEESVILALREVGLTGTRVEGYPGVWIGTRKICAIGVRMRRRVDREFVTSHGLALNVHTDLSHFQTIIPCGIADKGVTSVLAECGTAETLNEWDARMRRAFSTVFGCDVKVATSTVDETQNREVKA